MKNNTEAGFTLLELVIVVAIAIMISGFAIPMFLAYSHTAKLRSVGTDFSGLVQTARIRAIQDNRFYSIYALTTNARLAFVDIYPQSNTGVSGHGGTQIDPSDPAISISSEVSTAAAANAPNTSGLKNLFLPAGSTLPVNDASSSSTPITFGPRGLPCTTQSATGGTVCDSAGGATAFWLFLHNNRSNEWGAITVSPAGRVQKWAYLSSTWHKVA